MARGRERHEARLAEINRLGKDLARRAKRKCELCEEAGDLRPYDSAPDDEPTLETLALLCARCRDLASGSSLDTRTLRFLEQAIWSEVELVAAIARRALGDIDERWARDALELVAQ